MRENAFLIAGGGIAGLSASLALARAGLDSKVFEQAPAFEDAGAGLQMSPNGVRALQGIGAWEAVEPHCVTPAEIHVRGGGHGRLLQRIRLGKSFESRFGAVYRVCHRSGLMAGLLAAANTCPGIELTTSARALTATGEDAGASLLMQDGTRHAGVAVIAADGIGSRLRQAVCGPVEPVYRGHAIYRALLPFDQVPKSIAADCVTLWLCPGGHVVHYPVSGWRHFNIVAAIDSKPVPGDWNRSSDGGLLRHAFADACDMLHGLIATPKSWLAWQATDLPDLARWSKGNLLLVGDAAHASLPYLAQGAVMAIEDACRLAAHVSEGTGSLADRFTAFAAERRPRTARIQAGSRTLGRLYHARGPLALARDAALSLLGSDATIRRNAWIYGWKP